MNNNLTNQQLTDLNSLFELVSQRQLEDFGKISASSKADGSLITSCDIWCDKTIVNGLSTIAPNEGVLSEEGEKKIPKTNASFFVTIPSGMGRIFVLSIVRSISSSNHILIEADDPAPMAIAKITNI